MHLVFEVESWMSKKTGQRCLFKILLHLLLSQVYFKFDCFNSFYSSAYSHLLPGFCCRKLDEQKRECKGVCFKFYCIYSPAEFVSNFSVAVRLCVPGCLSRVKEGVKVAEMCGPVLLPASWVLIAWRNTESCVNGMSTKFLTREDIELSQRASTQALSEFRQSTMEDMNNVWQSVIMHPPPLQPATLSPLLPPPPPTPSTYLSSSSCFVC